MNLWGLTLLALLLLPLPVAQARCPMLPRSAAVLRAFQRLHPCPATGKTTGACPGWVKDHVRALACGGKDEVANLQWQQVAAARAKDKWERLGCPPCARDQETPPR